MKFQKVDVLIHGKKYRVSYGDFHLYTGTYVTTYHDVKIFKNIQSLCSYLFLHDYYYQDINEHYEYSEPIFQRKHIQNAMESRAVNLLLQRITGDPTFIWAEPTVPHLPYNPPMTLIMGL